MRRWYVSIGKKVNQLKWDTLEALGRRVKNAARKTTLTPEQEKLNMKLTWQSFDDLLYTCTLGSEEELKKLVIKPQEWREHVEELVFEFEDEVGVWVGLKNRKVAVTEKVHAQQRKRQRLRSKTQRQALKVEQAEQEEGGGMHQTRGLEGKGEDKRRITFLHRLILENVAQTAKKRLKPRGRLDRTVVVLPGQYLNADYFDIDEKGVARWNRTWDYEYGGQPKKYEKGEPLGNFGMQLQQIKRAFPELLKKFLVLQQPAAFRDGIIVGWCMEDLHNRQKYVCMQNDLVGCQNTQEVKELRFNYMQPNTNILPEMTACSQLTDIMLAHQVHALGRDATAEVRMWMKARAKRQKTELVLF